MRPQGFYGLPARAAKAIAIALSFLTVQSRSIEFRE
jgi:hypothetical protein